MKNYSIGLDIGTSSVGYAVVDENQKVVRKGNKYLWGARLFENAEVAVARRGFRSTRRRYDRRRTRIKLLRKIFLEEINKVDADFFSKLNESFYNELDDFNKLHKISREEKRMVKEYNKKYPTIYHLRKHLCESTEKVDIRLVYLAVHHIIKYRGNFLYDADNFNTDKIDLKSKFLESFETVNSILKEDIIDISNIATSDYSMLENALNQKSKTDKKKCLKDYFSDYMNSNFANEFTSMLLGNKFNVAKMLNVEFEEKIDLEFKTNAFEEKYDDFESKLGEYIEVVKSFKDLYDMVFLKSLFNDSKETTVSGLMVERYNKHKEDLVFLRKLFRSDKKLFKKVLEKDFDKASLYSRYVNNSIIYDDFKKELTKEIDKLDKNSFSEKQLFDLSDKMIELENGTFLPRLTDSNNGKFPYQLNKSELLNIIKNQSVYYTNLLELSEDGKYKLIKLLEFRIPYYVGPLNTTTDKSGVDNKNAWIKKYSQEIITPYNFDRVVNKEESAIKFIEKMISNCTYLIKEKVMPADSILYSEFKVLNELKNIKIDKQVISLDLINKIYNELFLKERNITSKIFVDYIKSINEYEMVNIEISGYGANNKFANNMSSYIDFFGDEGFFANTSYDVSDAEKIIKYITVFEDKEILLLKLKKEYSDLSDSAISRLIKKRYNGWSNLCEKLLVDLPSLDKSENKYVSIMDLMRTTSYNFMQIINLKTFNFLELIDNENMNNESLKIDYSLVKDLATSPATKRGIYQALKIVDELVNYIGYEPTDIVIEMAREEGEKKRTDSRKELLKKTYDKHKEDIRNYKDLLKELNNEDDKMSEMIFLYFIQEGRCLYTGTKLDINDLRDCEVDHIVPRSLIPDNSLDNKALVLKECNQLKKNSFVLPKIYQNNEMKAFWNHLSKMKLISSKKFYNLTKTVYKDEDIEGFINRQLVETRQITKHVANILKNIYSDTQIIYLHANLSSNYRKKFELFKFREINNYHHAHDAYLACVLGFYQKKYLKKNIDFEDLKKFNRYLYDNKLYSELKYGYVINSLDPRFDYDEVTGVPNSFIINLNKIIFDTLHRNDIIVTKKTSIRKGEFYNQTKNSKGKKGVNLKDNLPSVLYGSYTSLNPAYILLVKYEKKKKVEQRLIGIPIYIDVKAKKNNDFIISYVKTLLELPEESNVEILSNKIEFNTKVDWDGQICYLVGATAKVEVCNAIEFQFKKEEIEKYKYTLKALFTGYGKDKVLNYKVMIDELLLFIIKKINTNYKLYNNLVDELVDAVGLIDSVESKESVIKELFKLLRTNSSPANLKCIGLSMAFGRKEKRTISHFKAINNSTTGIKEVINEF
ncbi:MAG: type II CRISPR RNA-guided endonuclease Cas9 [Mycoplasmatota bacterium]